jgi:hypothetical protein
MARGVWHDLLGQIAIASLIIKSRDMYSVYDVLIIYIYIYVICIRRGTRKILGALSHAITAGDNSPSS